MPKTAACVTFNTEMASFHEAQRDNLLFFVAAYCLRPHAPTPPFSLPSLNTHGKPCSNMTDRPLRITCLDRNAI
jgi:hypothetical protein